MKKEEKSNYLIVPTKEFGKAVANKALEDWKEQKAQYVIKQIHTIMERMEVVSGIKRRTDRQLELLQKQMKAIESGEFVIDTSVGYNPLITFNDKDLNIGWDETGRW